jgi:hypothetical protein
LTQLTPADYPTYYKTTAGKLINGLPVLDFNGTTDWLENTTITSAGSSVGFFFMVVAVTAGSTGGPINSPGGGAGWAIQWPTSGSSYIFSGNVVTIPVAAAGAHVISSQFGAGGQFWIGTVAQITASNTGSDTLPALSVGTNYNETSWFKGQIGEVIVYDTALTGPQITSIQNYLKAKWGL